MSKIPVAKGGFRSWASKHNENSPKSVLYEQKYQNHHDRMRDKENVTDDVVGASSSASPRSMNNFQPTAEDYARYDADRRLRQTARDTRVAQRAAENSARKSRTPEEVKSPATDDYFTPQIGSLSEMSDFETPATSKPISEKPHSRRPSASSTPDRTPISSKPPKHGEHRDVYSVCLSRRMEQTFTDMQRMVFAGKPIQEARSEAISKTFQSTRSIRGSRNTERTVLVTRSSSQPPPVDVLNRSGESSLRKLVSREPSPIREQSTVSLSYVESLLAAHQLHTRYADTSAKIEKQMTKAESLAFLQNLAKSTSSRSSVTSVTDPLLLKKMKEKIARLKDCVHKVNVVLESTHNLRYKQPFEMSRSDRELLRSLDNWIHLTYRDLVRKFDSQFNILTERMTAARQNYTEEVALKTQEDKERRRRRSSSVLRMPSVPDAPRIDNPEQAPPPPNGESPPLAPRPGYPNRDAATQVSARSAVDEGTQMTERQVNGVERLDLSSIESSSAPTQQQSELDLMLNEGIHLYHDTSLETINPQETSIEEHPSFMNLSHDSRNHLMMDIKFPTGNEITPRSGRSSLGDTSERFSEGLKFALEKCKVSQQQQEMEIIVEQREDVPKSPEPEETSKERKPSILPSPSIEVTSPTTSDTLTTPAWSLKSLPETVTASDTSSEEKKPKMTPSPSIEVTSPTSSDTLTTPSWSLKSNPETVTVADIKEETDVENDEFDPDVTQFEHEKEEREEARRLLQTPEEVAVEVEPVVLQKSLADEEEDGDETKQFRSHDEFEDTPEEELQMAAVGNSFMEDSADDSMFLLNNKPAVIPKSIFDMPAPSTPSTPVASIAPLHIDTPRTNLPPINNNVDDVSLETTFDEMDLEEFCHGDFLVQITPIMIKKAIELQDQLRGVDMVDAQSVWQPPVFVDFKLDMYDQFDLFDSFSTLLWSAVVDLINRNYLKLGSKLTEEQERRFAAEARDMIRKEFGDESKDNEWCNEVKLSKKLEGMVPLELDHRYDIRKAVPEDQRQGYQWQQVQMKVIDERFGRKELEGQLDAVYSEQRDALATFQLMEIAKEIEEEMAGTVPEESSEQTDHIE